MSINSYKPKWKRRDYLGPAGRERAALAEKNSRQSRTTAASRKKKSSPKRSTITLSKSWLKPRTAKRAAEEMVYRRRVKERLATEIPVCRAHMKRGTGIALATECHHRNGKRGKLLLYEPFWIFVCFGCHNWIHREDPEAAQELGLLGGAGEWNNQSAVKP